MERTVVDVSEAVYTRPCAWFYRLQTWCSLRFDDNRGLEPASLRNTTESLSGVLTRSKKPTVQTSSERNTIYLDKGCWLEVSDPYDVGYSFLQQVATYERDHLFPLQFHTTRALEEQSRHATEL